MAKSASSRPQSIPMTRRPSVDGTAPRRSRPADGRQDPPRPLQPGAREPARTASGREGGRARRPTNRQRRDFRTAGRSGPTRERSPGAPRRARRRTPCSRSRGGRFRSRGGESLPPKRMSLLPRPAAPNAVTPPAPRWRRGPRRRTGTSGVGTRSRGAEGRPRTRQRCTERWPRPCTRSGPATPRTA